MKKRINIDTHFHTHSFATMVDLIEYRAIEPDALVYRFLTDSKNEETITYKELDAKSKMIAAFLQHKGVALGDRVILIYPPGLDLITAFFGCMYAGAIAIPIYPPTNKKLLEKFQKIVNDSKPSLFLSSQQQLQTIQDLLAIKTMDNHKNVALNDIAPPHLFCTTDNIALSFSREWKKPYISTDHIAYLQYSSGSTGSPKGVMISHANMMHNLELISRTMVGKNCVITLWLPPYHDMGLVGGILIPLYSRVPATLMSPMQFLRNPFSWLQTISKFRSTTSGGPNFCYNYCVDKIKPEQKALLDLSCWDVAFNGAEHIHAHTLERFYEAFKMTGFKRSAFHPCYGLAEATLMVSTSDILKGYSVTYLSKEALKKNKIVQVDKHDKDAQAFVDSGTPQLKVAIVDPITNERALPNVIGEIWIHGDSVTSGYWHKNKNEKRAKIKGDLSKTLYFRTGDLGFILKGRLYITGRYSDVIVIHGKNYYPQDIEYTVSHAHPLICRDSSAAFSQTINDEDALAIVCEVRGNPDEEKQEDIISAIIQAVEMHNTLTPACIALLPPKSIPKTTSGKIRRQPCKQLLEEKALPVLKVYSLHPEEQGIEQACQITYENVLNKLLLTLNKLLHVPVSLIPVNEPLMNLGLDSIKLLELSEHIQQEFGVENVSIDELSKETVSGASQILYQNLLQHPSEHWQENIIVHEQKQKRIYSEKALEEAANMAFFPEIKALKIELAEVTHQGKKNLFFHCVDGIANNIISIEGKKYINFASYNYLGLAGNEKINKAVYSALKKYGSSGSASRIVSGQRRVHLELEQAICDLIGAENSITFPSGYGTNIAAITTLVDQDDLIIHDELSHNSLIQASIYSGATRLSFTHNNIDVLEALLKQHRPYYRRTLIITEGVFSMDGDIAPIPEIIALKKKYHALLMIDEAHSIGVLGKTGCGISEHFSIPARDVDVWMGTLSKSLASCGGYIAGEYDFIKYLKYRCNGFIFSASLAPTAAAASLKAIQMMLENHHLIQNLHDRSHQLCAALKKAGVNVGNSQGTPIIPVIVGDSIKAMELSSNLKKTGIYAMPIVYPAVANDAARVRLFVNAMHQEEEIDYTIKMIVKLYKKS